MSPRILYMSDEYLGMTECNESAYKVTRATLCRRQDVDPSPANGATTHLTVNNSKQNSALMRGPERAPNAFRPISEYDRSFGSSRMICARILALCAMVLDEPDTLESHARTCNK